MSSSTILYRFRVGTTFEALPLPGSAARLFDVKKAIVQAKKLDQPGAMEFDLSVRDATTDEEYTDETMLLPRGTRLIIQRLPAARGRGFLSRMQRHPYGGGGPSSAGSSAPPPPPFPPGGNNSSLYTIDNRSHGDDEEFVSTGSLGQGSVPPPPPPPQEDQELAALRAATDAANQANRSNIRGMPGGGGWARVAGQGPPPPGNRGQQQGNFVPRQRLNVDVGESSREREQEKMGMPKKRATGIPRTFLNLNAPPQTDGSSGVDADGNIVPLLQPNAIGFEELVNRGGGQSELATGSQRDLDYALKLTATSVPEYLQCAICANVVRDAMILPWDSEGRTTCDSCIRDALTQNAFRCPLTGQEGASPDDLLPNHALRKAAVQFIKGVMEKMEQIEKQQVDDDDADDKPAGGGEGENINGSIVDGDEKGVMVSKRTSITDRKKKLEDDDPFGAGGDDIFGGDVFAVAIEDKAEPDPDAAAESLAVKKETPAAGSKQAQDDDKKDPPKKETSAEKPAGDKEQSVEPSQNVGVQQNRGRPATAVDTSGDGRSGERSLSPAPAVKSPSEPSRRDRRRGPPIGYSMGPAGGAAVGPREDIGVREQDQQRGGSSFDGSGRADHHGYRVSDDRRSGSRGGSDSYQVEQKDYASSGGYGRQNGGRTSRNYEQGRGLGGDPRSGINSYGGGGGSRPRRDDTYGGRGGRHDDNYGGARYQDKSPASAKEQPPAGGGGRRSLSPLPHGDHDDQHRTAKRPRTDSNTAGGQHQGSGYYEDSHRYGPPRQHDEGYGRGDYGGGGGRGGVHRDWYGGGEPPHQGGGGRGGGVGGGRFGGGRGRFEDRGGGRGNFRGGRRGGRGFRGRGRF